MSSYSPRLLVPLLFSVAVQAGCFNSGQGDVAADAAVSMDVPRFDAGQRPDIGPRPDVGSVLDAAPIDAGVPIDAGAPIGCTEDSVSVIDCPMFVCDQLPRWYWNGHSCFPIECGSCEGGDCGSGPFEREECETAHDTCDSSLCRRSEGTWRFWGAADCGFVCGHPSGDDCANGPTCDCGAFASFIEGRGCVVMDSCIPPPVFISPQEYCEMSGGEWGGFCAHSHCGRQSLLECAQPACHCPWPQVYDEQRGCVEGEACFRGEGGCNALSLCAQGMACIDGNCEPLTCSFDG